MIKHLNELMLKVKCLFKGHKYNYHLGWGKEGNYDEVHIVCDRCDKSFFLFLKSDVDAWSNVENDQRTKFLRRIQALKSEVEDLQNKLTKN